MVSVDRQALQSVLILFTLLNPLSHMALDTESLSIILIRCRMFWNLFLLSWFRNRVLILGMVCPDLGSTNSQFVPLPESILIEVHLCGNPYYLKQVQSDQLTAEFQQDASCSLLCGQSFILNTCAYCKIGLTGSLGCSSLPLKRSITDLTTA